MSSIPPRPEETPEDILKKASSGVAGFLEKLRQSASQKKTDILKKPEDEDSFFQAVAREDIKAVTAFLDTGFNPNSFNKDGNTALHLAAMANALDMTRLLLERGANPQQGKQLNPLYIPMETAVMYGRAEMTELLARHGGYRAGELSSGWTLLHKACAKGSARVVEILLAAGADPLEKTPNGTTPLISAIKGDWTEVARVLLHRQGVAESMVRDFVTTDDKKRTAFQLANEHGLAYVVAAMLEQGANANGRNAEGKPLLLAAIDKGNVPLVRALAEAGADINKSSPPWQPALMHALFNTPLNRPERAEMVDLLIRLGADTDLASPVQSVHMTPLHAALFFKCPEEVLNAFLRHPVLLDIRDSRGWTPLMYAAHNGSKKHTEILLENGADPSSLNDKKESALDIAYPFEEITEILKKALEKRAPKKTPAPPGP